VGGYCGRPWRDGPNKIGPDEFNFEPDLQQPYAQPMTLRLLPDLMAHGGTSHFEYALAPKLGI
jgi:hypothetical protein